GAGVEGRGGGIVVSYSDVHDNLLGGLVDATIGAGNVNLAPQFENDGNDDYRVLAGDPTVDAGDPASPFANEPAPDGGRVNQGAFGNTAWATPAMAPAAGTAISPGDTP